MAEPRIPAGALKAQTAFMRAHFKAMRMPPEFMLARPDPLGYVLPYFNIDFWRCRLMIVHEGGPKYMQPAGESHIYFPQNFEELMRAMPMIAVIAEGEKKAAAPAYHWKVPAMGIGGKDNWHVKGSFDLHPELQAGISLLPPGATLAIVPDGDIHTRLDIAASYGSLAASIRRFRTDITVIVIELPEASPRLGLDDWMVSEPKTKTLEELLALPRIEQLPRMKSDLLAHAEYAYTWSKDGTTRTLLAGEYNIGIYVNGAFDFKMDTTLGPVKFDPAGQWSRLTDADIVYALQCAQRDLLTKFTMQHARHAVAGILAVNACSVLADWMRQIRWDGTGRLNDFFQVYAKADPSINLEYLRGVARALFTGFVGRVLDPGCKFDLMLVLVGAQGIGKSTLLQVLAGGHDYYAEVMHVNTIDDLKRIGKGAAVIDIAELHSWNRLEIAQVKGWLSAQWDTFIDKFDKLSTNRPKAYVAVGSTNEMGFLRDPTGERRYLPVSLTSIDLAAFRRDREQLLAEAVVMYLKGGIAFNVPGAEREQIKHKVQYSWTDNLEQAIDGALQDKRLPTLDGQPVITLQWIAEAVGEQEAKRYAKEIAGTLKVLGWESRNNVPAARLTWRHNAFSKAKLFKLSFDGKMPRQVRCFTLKSRKA